MDIAKIQGLIAELKADIEVKQQALNALLKLLSAGGDQATRTDQMLQLDSVNPVLFTTSDSYIDLAVKIITSNNYRPLPVKEIVKRIRILRGNPHIERRSVEATMYQHIKAKGDSSRITKVAPGMYGVRRMPREESVA
jgi:hypothetical protein